MTCLSSRTKKITLHTGTTTVNNVGQPFLYSFFYSRFHLSEHSSVTLTKKQGILCSISTQFHMSCGSSWGPPTYCMRDELYAPSSCGVGTTSVLQCGLNNERSAEVVTRTRPLS